MKLNELGRQKSERQLFLAAGEACEATFWPAWGFKGRTLIAPGSLHRGPWFLRSRHPNAEKEPEAFFDFNTAIIFHVISEIIHISVEPDFQVPFSAENTLRPF